MADVDSQGNLEVEEQKGLDLSEQGVRVESDPDNCSVVVRGLHASSVFSLLQVNKLDCTFVSGDLDHVCKVWKIDLDTNTVTHLQTLEGHTETVELMSWNHNQRLLATGGLNNIVRIWKLAEGGELELKCELREGPDEETDLNFIAWHPKGNAVALGGKDKNIWVMNGVNGEYVACLSAHKEDVTCALFSLHDGGKSIVSCSHDKTVRVWE